MVICTAIDANIDPSLADFLYAEGQSIGDYDELLTSETRLKANVKQLARKLKLERAKVPRRKQARGSKKAKMSPAEIQKLQSTIHRLTERLDLNEAQLADTIQEKFQSLVDTRNAYAKRRLTEEKQEHLAAGKTLEVFCVSNAHYNMLKGAEDATKPQLDPDTTGIPALRESILKRAAPAQATTLEGHLYHKYAVFMKGLAMWAKSYNLDGSDDLLEKVAAPQERLGEILQRYHHGVLAASKDIIVGAISMNLMEIVHKANKQLNVKKKDLHWSTIRALVRRDGNGKTSVVPKSSWNEDFLDGASQVVEDNWDDFVEKEKALASQLEKDLVGLVEDIATAVKGHPAYYVLPMKRLEEVYEAQIHGIRQAATAHSEGVARALRNIQLDLTHEQPTGYFTQAMAQAYTQAKDTTGSGYKLRVMSIFEIHLSLNGARSPFMVMCKAFTQAVSTEIAQLNAVLGGSVSGILQNIHRQYKDLVEERIEDKADAKLSEDFAKFLVWAEPRFEDMKLEWKRIKRRHGM